MPESKRHSRLASDEVLDVSPHDIRKFVRSIDVAQARYWTVCGQRAWPLVGNEDSACKKQHSLSMMSLPALADLWPAHRRLTPSRTWLAGGCFQKRVHSVGVVTITGLLFRGLYQGP